MSTREFESEASIGGTAARVLVAIDDFHMRKGPIHETLENLVARLPKHDIEYAVVGGIALAVHGFVRPTDDVDLLVTREGLARFRDELVGLGYRPEFPGAQKSFRDTATGVKVEFLTAGEYPGDGIPKPVAFPDPATASVDVDGVRVIELAKLVEMKLASGLSAPHRLKDLADVQELIGRLSLPESFGEGLDVSVRAKFDELWAAMKRGRRMDEEHGFGF